MLGTLQRCRVWLAHYRTPQLLAAATSVQFSAFLIDHQIRSFPDSRAYLQAAHAWFDPSTWVPVRRYQQNLFSIIWAPFVRLPDLGPVLIVEAILLLLLAVLIFHRGLLRLRVDARTAWWAALAAACLPPALYFERMVMSESLAYDEVLVWVALVAWAGVPWRSRRVFVVAVYTLLIAGTTRSAFLQFFLAVVAVLVVSAVVAVRRGWPLGWRPLAAGASALVLGAGVGMFGASAVQGLASHVSPMTAIRNSSAISGFMLVSKYGGLVPCDPPRVHIREVICQAGPGVDTSDAADLVFWYTGLTSDWNNSTPRRFAELGREYRSLAISSILHDPLGAAGIVVRDGAHMLLPIQSYRYVSDPATLSALSASAPGLELRSPSTWSADSDLPYRASAAFDVFRCFAVIALVVIAIRRMRSRRSRIGVLLVAVWVLSFLALAASAYPTERYLMPLDPLLVAAAALMFARDECTSADGARRG